MTSRMAVGVGALVVMAVVALLLLGRHAPARQIVRADRQVRSHCAFKATPSNFASRVLAASGGQTICLASGNYGTWSGTNKAITIAAASGASPQMVIAFKSGASAFTLNGMTNLSGTIDGGSNITIQNSAFTNASCTVGCLDIEGSMSNLVINHDTFSYAVTSTSSGPNSKVFLDTSGSSPGRGGHPREQLLRQRRSRRHPLRRRLRRPDQKQLLHQPV